MKGQGAGPSGGRIAIAAAVAFIAVVIAVGRQHRNPLANVAPARPSGLPSESEPPWVAPLRAVDEALAKQNIGSAERAWHRAYTAALGSRGWEGLVKAGDAALRIGEVAGLRQPYEATARKTYLPALFRARGERSVEGVLRTAEAFAALGDREVVEQCLVIARRLVTETPDPGARARAADLTERFAARLHDMQPAERDLF